MPGHEIITLQLGSYANYVGAHFWNLQDEVAGQAEHDAWGPLATCLDVGCLYSEGLDLQGHVTWRPRTLFADLSGALGGVRPGAWSAAPHAAATAAAAAVSTWSGSVQVHRAAPLPKSHFVTQLEEQADEDAGDDEDEGVWAARQAALESAAAALSIPAAEPHQIVASSHSTEAGLPGVRYWTDYLKVVLPPHSVLTLPGVWQGTAPFSGYGDGVDLVGPGSEMREEMSERIRALVEDCDSLQGFQVFAEDLSGWGAITHTVMQEVHEEYCQGGRPCLLFSVRPPPTPGSPIPPADKLRHSLNEGLVLSWVADLVTLYTPITLPEPATLAPADGLSWLQYSPGLHFETAAVIAAAIDTALSPVRFTSSTTPLGCASGAVNMHSLACLLTGAQRGSPLTALATALPLPALPIASQQAQASLDPRMATSSGSSAGQRSSVQAAESGAPQTSSAGSGGITCDLQQQQQQVQQVQLLDLCGGLTCITPGVANNAGTALAESLCMRGARTVGGLASVGATQEALGLLERTQRGSRMCVRHHAVCPLPLLLPLPFPRTLWGPCVGLQGQLYHAQQQVYGCERSGALDGSSPGGHAHGGGSMAQQRSQAGAAGLSTSPKGGGNRAGMAAVARQQAAREVTSAPIASKLFATTQFQPYVQQVAASWRRASGSGSGQAMLDQWQVERADADHVVDSLQHLASLYEDSDNEDGL